MSPQILHISSFFADAYNTKTYLESVWGCTPTQTAIQPRLNFTCVNFLKRYRFHDRGAGRFAAHPRAQPTPPKGFRPNTAIVAFADMKTIENFWVWVHSELERVFPEHEMVGVCSLVGRVASVRHHAWDTAKNTGHKCWWKQYAPIREAFSYDEALELGSVHLKLRDTFVVLEMYVEGIECHLRIRAGVR